MKNNSVNNYPIFHQPWWLDSTVGAGNWGECIVEKGGEIHARLPYVLKKKYGFTVISQPPLTQYLGPWFKEVSGAKYSKSLSREKDLTEELINQLPKYDYFIQNFSPSITNWQPWYWEGFKQTTNYTYRLDDLSNINELWEGMESKIRTDIRKAEKLGVSVQSTDELTKFWSVHQKTFSRQGKCPPYTFDFLLGLDAELKQRNFRRILLALDEKGQVHAGAYLVWNDECIWYLMGGGDPELRNSGATSLVIWEAIKIALDGQKVFDFEGSMIESVERFFRGFGAKQKPFSSISKTNSRLLKLGSVLKRS